MTQAIEVLLRISLDPLRASHVNKCWCGDIHEPHCPSCEDCGAPITTGLMALLCPKRTACAMWPEGMADEGVICEMIKPYGLEKEPKQ